MIRRNVRRLRRKWRRRPLGPAAGPVTLRRGAWFNPAPTPPKGRARFTQGNGQERGASTTGMLVGAPP